MKRDPYSVLKEIAKEVYERDKKSLDFFFEYSDKLITWLIGFAVGGISLMVANFTTLKSSIPKSSNLIILFLSLTIIFGFLYRLTAYFYIKKNKNLEHYFSGVFSDVDMTPVVAEDISTASIEDMLMHIKLDFGQTPEDFKKNSQPLVLEFLKEYYLSLIDFSKKQFYIAADSLAETYELVYKIKKDISITRLEIAFGLKQTKSNSIGFNAKRWSSAISYFFSSSIISFLICIIVICILFFLY